VRANAATANAVRFAAAMAARDVDAIAAHLKDRGEVIDHTTGATYDGRGSFATWRSLLNSQGGTYRHEPVWYRNLQYDAERARGLDFVPLAQERYFLVTRAPALEHPHVQALRSLLATPAWIASLESIPGYTAERSGEVLSLRSVLPWWSYRSPKRR